MKKMYYPKNPTEIMISREKLPKHVAIIMDGNGRWAKSRYLPRLEGHRKGIKRVREIVECCLELNISSLTLFAFSEQNWKRPQEEVNGLFKLLKYYFKKEKANIINKNIHFKVIGEPSALPKDVLDHISELERDTNHHSGLKLNIALNYGARGEIVRAAQRLFENITKNNIKISDVNEDMFSKFLDNPACDDVDLLIRTSGEHRISNFLLWQISYAELFFEKSYWPDFSKTHFLNILDNYAKRERRFGLTSEQQKSIRIKA